MTSSEPFSVLNQRLKPRFTTSEQLCSSLNRLEDRQSSLLRSRFSSYQPTHRPEEPEPKVSATIPEQEEPEENEGSAEQEDLVSDDLQEMKFSDLLPVSTSSLLTELNLTDVAEEADDDSGSSHSEEKDGPGELATEGTRDSSKSVALAGGGESSIQRKYIDGTLPDLINSGRPLGRRRTVGHVSVTLNEVRREVELSRKRSIRLKAQVDKIQESRDGVGWSQHRERVTEEVLSTLRLLHPLTELKSMPPECTQGGNCLDAALAQLQVVARKLAISHTKQDLKPGKGEEQSAILEQALRDRDEAIERKKAMEAELLRSKTEMMMLNNQLLEAVQKRLELSLELEAWKDDVQLILHQHLQSQQQAEQNHKKSTRLGILRRNNKPPIQRPASFSLPAPIPPTVNSNHIFIPRSAVPSAAAPSTPPPVSSPPSISSPRTWRSKLRRGKSSRHGDQDTERGSDDNGFQVVSLD